MERLTPKGSSEGTFKLAASGNDVNMLILDIGYRFTKFGFSKDFSPKGIIATPLSIS